MYFLLESKIDKLYLADHPLDFAIGGPTDLNLLLRPLPDIDDQGRRQIGSVCIATCRREPSLRIVEMFRQLAEGNLDKCPMHESRPKVDQEGRTRDAGFSFHSSMPSGLQAIVDAVWKELHETSLQLVTVLRWRYGVRGEFYPIRGGSIEWSLDARTYFDIAPPVNVIHDPIPRLELSVEECVQLLELMQQVGREPLGRELYREAWEQIYDNPRSALLVGIAALEVGSKQSIASLAPETAWLMDNMPSPRLVDLIWGYMPSLIDSSSDVTSTLRPPFRKDGRPTGKIYDAIMKGVKLRNEIVHTAAGLPQHDTLVEVLGAVSDLLWIFDSYCGNTWALAYVSEATLAEWGHVPAQI